MKAPLSSLTLCTYLSEEFLLRKDDYDLRIFVKTIMSGRRDPDLQANNKLRLICNADTLTCMC